MFSIFFEYEFIRNSITVGILISIVCSMLGVFIVQRKMSFLGSGLSHSALGGIGLGLLLGIEPLFIAIPFTLIVSLLITLLNEKTKIELDTSIGILFSASIALGIIFIAMKNGYSSDAYSYLFGSVLAISNIDVFISMLIVLLTVIIICIYWKDWAYITFDKELAISDGINVKRGNNIFSIILALVIVISVKLVGIVLISAFLILPPAIARLFSKTFIQMTVLAIVFGLISTILGLYISFVLDIPSGATIIIIQSIIFALSAIYSRQINRG